MESIRYSVDFIKIKDNLCFIYGWVFDYSAEINSVFLKLSKNGKIYSIPMQYGGYRDDVALAFKSFPNAPVSGLLGYGSFGCDINQGDELFLELNYKNKSEQIFLDYFKSDNKLLGGGAKKYILNCELNLRRISFLFRMYGAFPLLKKIKSKLMVNVNAKDPIESLFKRNKNYILIVDHKLGGGANEYRNQLVADLIKDHKVVVVLTYDLNSLNYVFFLIDEQSSIQLQFPGWDKFYSLIGPLKFTDLIYNTAVSIGEPHEILKLMLRFKKMGASLRVLIHDYYLLCPSHFLLNNKGRYCGLPSMDECNVCLKINTHGFVTLNKFNGIEGWRQAWGQILENKVDKIICFSEDSAKKLLKIYPNCKSKISINPHEVNYLNVRRIGLKNTAQLCIGVVGNISLHKGADFIKELALEIESRGLPINIKVIGRLQINYESSLINETGLYPRDELPKFILESGANIFLFPSVCPETFSYTVQELISLDLPVACFNLGAPPERLKKYKNGLVLLSMNAKNVLDELLLFHSKIYK